MLVLKTIKIVHLCVVLRNGKLPYDNMDNLLSLSREGDMTSSRKGIVDNLSMTYDGCRLVSVSDSATAPSVAGSADFATGPPRPWSTPMTGTAMESTWSAGTGRSAAGPMAWRSQGLAVH